MCHLAVSLLVNVTNVLSSRRIVVFLAVAFIIGSAGYPSIAQDTTTTTTAPPTSETTSETTTTTAAPTTTTAAPTTAAPTTTAPPETTTTTAATAETTTTAAPTMAATKVEPVADEVTDNAPTGRVSENLAASLAEWNNRVKDKEAELEKAQARLDQLEGRAEGIQAEIEETRRRIAELEATVVRQAINSFQEPDGTTIDLLNAAETTTGMRARTLLNQAVTKDLDVVEELRAAKENLRIQQALADQAAADADAATEDIQAELSELEEARDKKAVFTSQAAASLGVVTEADIVTVRGFEVHKTIADNVAGLIDAAAADGIKLGGGGYRSFERQIAVRKNNCGTSHYAIWEMSAGSCRPPTARPGASMHEKGLALDLTCDGALIRSRGSRCFQWLAGGNAEFWGFKNLPSEPWHWSTNGR